MADPTPAGEPVDPASVGEVSERAPRLSTVRTPMRHRPRPTRAVTSGIDWFDPEAVPGAVLSAESQRRLSEYDAAWRAAQARARVSGATYVIFR